MGSMLRAFRRRQGATGRGFRRWGRQDRPGAFMRAWLALTDPIRGVWRPGPVLAPLGRPLHQFGGRVPLGFVAYQDESNLAAGNAGTPSPSVPSAEDSRISPQQVVEAAEKGWRLFRWIRRVWRMVKRGPRGV